MLKAYWERNRKFILGLVALFAMRWTLIDHYRVPSGSMEPTLVPGDDIFVQKVAYDFRIPFTPWVLLRVSEPQRGDVIVFEHPIQGVTMVKRLIGIPGDHLVIHDGKLEINGQLVTLADATLPLPATELSASEVDPQPQAFTETLGIRQHFVLRLPTRTVRGDFDIVVPDDSYFAMGDSRDNSSDSRFWGFVPRALLKGRARNILWSLGTEGHNWPPIPRWNRFGSSLH